jgi:peptide/nickel transport system permease protein
MGAGHLRILVRYILPEIAGPMGVQATFAIAGAVLGEASLSFLGLGPQGVVSWGGLLEQGAILFIKSPALVISAGGALLLLLAGMNLIGDGLRDHLDPRLEGRRGAALERERA